MKVQTNLISVALLVISFLTSVAQASPNSPKIVIDLSSGLINESRILALTNNEILNLKECVPDSEFYKKIPYQCDSSRYTGALGKKIEFIIYHPNSLDDFEIKIVEEKRDSVLKSNLGTFAQIIDMILDDKGMGRAGISITQKTITLKEKRSVLKIVVNKKGSSEILEKTLITGRSEHLYLSADIMVNETKQLKFNSATSSLVERNAPSKFHIGLNYQLGDLLTESRSQLDRVVLKAFFLADSRPLNSYGVGIGYRPRFLEFGNLFVSYHRFLQDSETDGVRSEEYVGEVRFGVGFNLDSALSWLKSN